MMLGLSGLAVSLANVDELEALEEVELDSNEETSGRADSDEATKAAVEVADN